MNRNAPAGEATALGLLLAVVLIAVATALAAFWDAYTVVPTPDGPAVVQVDEAQR